MERKRPVARRVAWCVGRVESSQDQAKRLGRHAESSAGSSSVMYPFVM
jgi:hypothetical protein